MFTTPEQTVSNLVEAVAGLTAESSAILLVDQGDTYHEIGLNLSAADRLCAVASILESTIGQVDAQSVEAGLEFRGMITAMVMAIL